MHKLLLSLFALALLATTLSAQAGPVTGHQAKSHISQRLQYSKKVRDKQRPFKVKLGGKKGDRIRSFQASNLRPMVIPGNAPHGAQGGVRITVGNVVSGTLNMETGAVRTTSVVVPR